MIATLGLRIFEKFVLCEQSHGGFLLTGNLSKLTEMTESNRLGRQEFNQPWVQERISGLGDHLPVDILRIDLYIDRKLNNCFHNNVKLGMEFVFVLLGLIRAANLATERPETSPWEKEMCLNFDSWT